MPNATLMGPGSEVFANLMGPANRQGHGATPIVRSVTWFDDREQRQGANRRRRGSPSGGADGLGRRAITWPHDRGDRWPHGGGDWQKTTRREAIRFGTASITSYGSRSIGIRC